MSRQVLSRPSVPSPVPSGIAKWLSRHSSQQVCPWNVRFARELPDESPCGARGALAGKDARTLAREPLGMSQEEFSRAFSKSPMKRAKLRGLERNSAVVLGNVGAPEDVPAPVAALSDDELLVRSHAAWALGRLGSPVAVAALRDRLEGSSPTRRCVSSWQQRSTCSPPSCAERRHAVGGDRRRQSCPSCPPIRVPPRPRGGGVSTGISAPGQT
jgi:hypothetical protein